MLASTSLVFSVADPRPAQAGNNFGAALGVGLEIAAMGLIASQALANRQPSRARAPVKPKKPVANQQTANQTLQKALRQLGFYSGGINGKLDKPTLSAIAAFQQKMGDKPTGKITPTQRQVLLANYAQSVGMSKPPASGIQSNDIFSAIAGGAAGATFANSFGNAVATPAAPSPEPLRPQYFRQICKDEAPGESATLRLRPLSELHLLPDQFCVARTSAVMTAGEALKKTGQSDISTVRNECRLFTDNMKTTLATLSTDSPATFAGRLKKDFAPVANNAETVDSFRVCLGIGYVEDAPDMILASSSALIGAGETGFGEILGGVLGVGLEPYNNWQKSAEWLDFTATAVEKGALPVGSGLIDHNQKMTAAAIQMAEKKVWAQRS